MTLHPDPYEASSASDTSMSSDDENEELAARSYGTLLDAGIRDLPEAAFAPVEWNDVISSSQGAAQNHIDSQSDSSTSIALDEHLDDLEEPLIPYDQQEGLDDPSFIAPEDEVEYIAVEEMECENADAAAGGHDIVDGRRRSRRLANQQPCLDNTASNGRRSIHLVYSDYDSEDDSDYVPSHSGGSQSSDSESSDDQSQRDESVDDQAQGAMP